jgi:hypothetical protein
VIPALISASVALLIFALTQWILHRREQTKLLLGKLEELYLLVLQFGELNGRRFERLLDHVRNDRQPADPEDDTISFSEWFGVNLGQKLELYVDFYFPRLRDDLERLYAANREMNGLLVRRDSGRLTYAEMRRAGSEVGEAVGMLCRQILAQRRLLTKNLSAEIAAWYDRSTYGGGSS